MSMYSFHQFSRLPAEVQLDELNAAGVALDLAYSLQAAEAVLFAYDDFYVEMLVARHTDEILALKSFRSLKRLEPFLHQVDISEITVLLSWSE